MWKSWSFVVMSVFIYGGSLMAENKNLEKATLAGGCFWCMQKPYDKADGVVKTIVGYTGGNEKSPQYEQVASGKTGHREAIEVYYDPKKITYKKILDVFWREIDPTDKDGQFADRGKQYSAGIFYHSEEQKNQALESKKILEKSEKFKKPIVTEILEAGGFYKAEEYHQKYYKKNPIRYKFYRHGSGRDQFLKKVWQTKEPVKKESKVDLKKKLTPLQYKVTQENATEPAFKNTYWDNKKAGIYVDVVSGEALYSSLDKFDSGTGWPAFSKSLSEERLVLKEDNSFFMKRTEVRSKKSDSHLGHLFKNDKSKTGKHHCINSAAMRFIPIDKLKEEGYGDYLKLFQADQK